MPMTRFRPTADGFLFPNRFEDVVVDDPVGVKHVIVGAGRCGGMSYAATDFFLAGIPAPRTIEVPYGLALGDFIWERQVRSVLDSADKWVVMPLQSDEQLNQWMLTDEMPKLRARIDAGRPVPIGLIARGLSPADHHQVVAYGYDQTGPDTWSIHIYDPNSPRLETTLHVSRGAPVQQIDWTGQQPTEWRMYFVKEGYEPIPPRG